MIIPTNEETHVQPRLDYAEATPEVLQAMLALQRAVDASGLEPSLLDLVKVRASQINGCAFCLDMHHRDAVQRGETSARLYLLNAWHEAPGYTARERAALRWTEALTRLAPVADDTYAEVSAQFSGPELSRLTLAIVTINGWNRFNVGFRVPPELAA